MDSRISELRNQIRELRTSMLEAEAVMREQIMQDEDCSAAGEALRKMRAAMAVLARERAVLGDREPLLVTGTFIPRRPPMLYKHPVKHRLVPPVAQHQPPFSRAPK
jgi:hypothetical protein